MDESIVLSEIQNLRKEMNNGFLQIQSTITKLEGEGRQNAIELGKHSERMGNLDERLKEEIARNREYAGRNSLVHDSLFEKIKETREGFEKNLKENKKASEDEDKSKNEKLSSMNIRPILIAVGSGLAGGGGGGLITKFLFGQ